MGSVSFFVSILFMARFAVIAGVMFVWLRRCVDSEGEFKMVYASQMLSVFSFVEIRFIAGFTVEIWGIKFRF
jgi:hypothetical protein